jgi:hypothetical protein
MPYPLVPTRRRALGLCAVALVTALACAALIAAAALVPAPRPILPVAILTGIAMPMAMAYELPAAIATLRHHSREIGALRRHLAALPEAPHPFEPRG